MEWVIFGIKSPLWLLKISKFSKIHSGNNISQIPLPNMWLLVQTVFLWYLENNKQIRKHHFSQVGEATMANIQPKSSSSYSFCMQKAWQPNLTLFSLSVLSKTVENKNFNYKWHNNSKVYTLATVKISVLGYCPFKFTAP